MAPIRLPSNQVNRAPSNRLSASAAFNMSDLAGALAPSTTGVRTSRIPLVPSTPQRLTRRMTRSAPGRVQKRSAPATRRSDATVAALSTLLDAVSLDPCAAPPFNSADISHLASSTSLIFKEAIAWPPAANARWKTLANSSDSPDLCGIMAERKPSESVAKNLDTKTYLNLAKTCRSTYRRLAQIQQDHRTEDRSNRAIIPMQARIRTTGGRDWLGVPYTSETREDRAQLDVSRTPEVMAEGSEPEVDMSYTPNGRSARADSIEVDDE